MKTYDVNYFIRKFEAIPEKYWSENAFLSYDPKLNDQKNTCAMGFCGGWTSQSRESMALSRLLRKYYQLRNIEAYDDNDAVIYWINDSKLIVDLSTPKQRILAALYDIKKSEYETVQPKTECILVQVDSKVKDLTKEELIMN